MTRIFIAALMLLCWQVIACNGTDTPAVFRGQLEVTGSQPENDAPLSDAQKQALITRAKRIGQLAEGMRRIKEKRDLGNWYYCGRLLSKEEQEKTSTEIAYHLVDNLDSVDLDVSPWGILGTMYNESGFDPCALGLHPRKWAYQEGYLRPRKQCISHTPKEVLAVIRHPAAIEKYQYTGVDLGICQILSRFYPNQIDEMLSLNLGIRICVLEMHARARQHKTKSPWLFWRGSATDWYLAKVNRWVRLMKKV